MASRDEEQKEIDEVSGVETTGHEWDGIKELNNPLPRWWLWTFYATIIFSVGYMAYYPAIPLIESSTMGISGKTNRGDLKQELAAAKKAQEGLLQKIEASSLEQIKSNPDLLRFAVAGGESLYKVNCSQCHGSGAQGAAGYPNLNDDDWLWGGDLKAIYHSIKHGIRNRDSEDARDSQMPAFGEDLLEPAQIADVTEYVLQLSGDEVDQVAADRGKPVYAENCASCHGEQGKGNREFGAPNLSDALWLYGSTKDLIKAQIKKPSHGVMPAWGLRLTDASVKKLTLYVHSLGGGEQTRPAEQASN